MAPDRTTQRIAVIIPAYRAAGTIGRCLDSILRQTRPADEILVVDDGSPDDLAAAVAPYGDAVTLIRQANAGVSAARNTGIDATDAELIAFLDADDYWEPEKLARQLAVLERDPDVGLVACAYASEAPDGTPLANPLQTPPWVFGPATRYQGPRAFDFAGEIMTSTVLVRRAVLGTERFLVGLRTAEDRDLWVRIASRTQVVCLPERLMRYVTEPNSLSRSSPDQDFPNMLRVVERHAELLGRAGVRRWRIKTYRSWAGSHLGLGQARAAVRPAWSRVRAQPCSAEGWWVLAKALWLSLRGANSPSRPPAPSRRTLEPTPLSARSPSGSRS